MSDAGHLPSAVFGDPQQRGQAAADPSPSAPKRANARLASAFIVAVVLAIMTAAALVERSDSGLNASAALAYMPPSGTRVLLQGSDGTDTVDEYFTTVGLPALQRAAPPPTVTPRTTRTSFGEPPGFGWRR